MQITIVIPVLNEAARIDGLVRYLLKNDKGLVAEIIVVDGGSSDSTVELARAAGALVLKSQLQSRAAQMNLGAQQAQSDWLWFVHADTLPPASFPDDLRNVVSRGYVCACYRYRFDSNAFLLRINSYFNRFSMLWCQGGDKTFFIQKALFESYGGYNERYVIMEEYDFLRRMCQKIKLHTIPKNALVSARKYESNSWLRVQLANMLTFTMFRFGVEPMTMKRFYRKIIG